MLAGNLDIYAKYLEKLILFTAKKTIWCTYPYQWVYVSFSENFVSLLFWTFPKIFFLIPEYVKVINCSHLFLPHVSLNRCTFSRWIVLGWSSESQKSRVWINQNPAILDHNLSLWLYDIHPGANNTCMLQVIKTKVFTEFNFIICSEK